MNDRTSKNQLIATEMRPTSADKTELLVRFNRPFTTEEMNAMHRALNLHLVGVPDETAAREHRMERIQEQLGDSTLKAAQIDALLVEYRTLSAAQWSASVPLPVETSETNNLKCVSVGCTNDCEKGNPYLCAEHARSPLNGTTEQT